MNGIDVSIHQGIIDWKKVKKSGIDFAIIKSSQGGSTQSTGVAPFADKYFAINVNAAYKAGLKCGVYHYLTGTTEEMIKTETRFLIELLKPYKAYIELPVALDLEDIRYTKLDPKVNVSLARIFMSELEAAGYKTMLYTNRNFKTKYFTPEFFDDINVWFALYRNPRNSSNKPEDCKKMLFWQWTDSGQVDGIDGKVDMNVSYIELPMPTPKPIPQTGFATGDTVKIKASAVSYYKNGPSIPAWVKNDYLHIITGVAYAGKKVTKNGDECVLLGKMMSAKTGQTTNGINSWVSINNIERIK